jgi:fructose-bisphosphate aldolase class II
VSCKASRSTPSTPEALTITSLRFATLLQEAAATKRGIGAFNVVFLEHGEAIVAGAERAGLPVILQISENCIRSHSGIEPLTAASLAMARAAKVPVLVHLGHDTDPELVDAGIGRVCQISCVTGVRLVDS